jgi:4-amino-4-deoxy-L-arabinose transferase-like glycosyltransferase
MEIIETGSQSVLKLPGKRSVRAWVALAFFTLALQIILVSNHGLSGRDSPRVAGIAREMAVTSNYLVPRLNGENFLEYPPLGYWPIALTLSMSQRPADFLAFLPILLLGTGTVLITYLIGKTLAGGKIGVLAGFILATMPSFISYHRHFRVDPVLLFFITLSLYGFVAWEQSPKKRRVFSAIFYLGMAGGFLSKGIIGAAIPLGTALVFLISKKELPAIRKLLVTPTLLCFVVPVLLWVGSVWWFEGPDIIKEVVRQSLWRFLSPSADHAKPFYYYFGTVLVAPLPWILLVLGLLWYRQGAPHLRKPGSGSSLLRFAVVWALTVFLGLSAASAKRALYLGPIYPPVALLAALGWHSIREKFPHVKQGEVYGLLVIFLVYVGVYLFFITPVERKESLRSVFKVVSSQQVRGRVYLVSPSETTQGASFFYLGGKMPVLKEQDLLTGRFEDRPGTILVVDSYDNNNELLSILRSKGYHAISQRKYAKTVGVYVYTKGP